MLNSINFIVLSILNYSVKFSHLTHQNYAFATLNFFTARTIQNATNSRALFPLRRFAKVLAIILYRNPLEMHAVIIPISVYFFIGRPCQPRAMISRWQLSIVRIHYIPMCKISIAYISAISKPIHFWFSPTLSAV